MELQCAFNSPATGNGNKIKILLFLSMYICCFYCYLVIALISLNSNRVDIMHVVCLYEFSTTVSYSCDLEIISLLYFKTSALTRLFYFISC